MVRVDDLRNEIKETKKKVDEAKGARKRDLQRHLGKLRRELAEFLYWTGQNKK